MPVYSHDGLQAPLVEASQQLYVLSVQHPSFRSIHKSADDDCHINSNLVQWEKRVVLLHYAVLEATKGAGFGEIVVMSLIIVALLESTLPR